MKIIEEQLEKANLQIKSEESKNEFFQKSSAESNWKLISTEKERDEALKQSTEKDLKISHLETALKSQANTGNESQVLIDSLTKDRDLAIEKSKE